MKEPINAEDWRTIGIRKYKNGNYEESIAAFHKSLALKEDWNSYHGLGGALLKTNQYKEAINAFRRSIELKEDWSSYQALGLALFKTKAFVLLNVQPPLRVRVFSSRLTPAPE